MGDFFIFLVIVIIVIPLFIGAITSSDRFSDNSRENIALISGIGIAGIIVLGFLYFWYKFAF